MGKQLPAKRARSALEKTERWADLPQGERRRRCAAAVRDGDRETLADIFEAYTRLYSRRKQQTSDHTLATYRRGMNRLLDWCEGKARKAHRLTDLDASRFVGAMQADGLSPKTVQTYVTGARQFLEALRWCKLTDAGNPFENVSVDDPTPPEHKADPYDVEELRRLLDVAGDSRERAVVLLAADAGLRLAEAAGLRWADVDLDRRRVTVRAGKGGKTRRVAITNRLRDTLEALGADTSGPVMGVKRRRMQQLMTDLCDRADVAARGYHNLRHSCGARLFKESGGNLLVVARHLGHSVLETARLYAHLSDEAYEEAVEALEGNGAT